MKERLRELRLEQGLTQKQLAQILNSTDKNIWAYEKGIATPPYEVLIMYAKYFGVSADYLLGLEDDFGARTVSTTASSSDSLTEKEKALLRAFKKLLPEMQDFILQSAQSLSDKASAKSLK